jgi:hypothetical protein
VGLKGNGSKILDTHRKFSGEDMSKNSLAIAYGMKKKAERKKMADGGDVDPSPSPAPSPSPIDPDKAASAQGSMRQAFGYADGGEVHGCENCGYQPSGKVDTDPDMGFHEFDKGYVDHEGDVKRPNKMAMSEDHRGLNQHPVDMHAETSMDEQDMVDRIMMNRKQNNAGEAKFSKGGMVANQDKEITGDMPNEFDDLHLRDDLESSYGEGDNSGDDLGNDQEDEDRADLVDRIMLKNFKQKIPRGYPGR